MSVNALPFLDSSSAAWDLALDKKFTDTVVEAYQQSTYLFNEMYPGVLKMNDDNGYQGQFIQKAPDPDPDETYTPGTRLEGQAMGFREDFITNDSPLVVHKWFRKDHVKVSHFPVIEPTIRGMGEALGRKVDARGFITLAKAARATSAVTDSQSNLTIHSGGNRVVRVAASEALAYPTTVGGAGPGNFRSDCDDLCQAMDEDNVPREGRILFITPRCNRVMQLDTGIFDIRYAQDSSANNLQKALLGEMSGFKIVMVNGRIPQTNINGAGVPSKYQGNFGVAAQASGGLPVALAVGGVRQGSAPVGWRQIGGIEVEREYHATYQSWFAAISLLGGYGQMHQYCAGSIEVASS